jgi:hypothetical protein
VFTLRCPHGKPVRMEEHTGLVTYIHEDKSGDECTLMDSFGTPSREVVTKFASDKRFNPEVAFELLHIQRMRTVYFKHLSTLQGDDLATEIKRFVGRYAWATPVITAALKTFGIVLYENVMSLSGQVRGGRISSLGSWEVNELRQQTPQLPMAKLVPEPVA